MKNTVFPAVAALWRGKKSALEKSVFRFYESALALWRWNFAGISVIKNIKGRFDLKGYFLGISGDMHHDRLMRILGYVAGIAAGVTYGMNPLFGVPLLRTGMPVATVLFYRYFLAAVCLGVWLLFRRIPFKVSGKATVRLLCLGVLYTLSSVFLFAAYRYIPSGIATTIVFLYPVLVAVMMCFFKIFPTWQVWVSIAMTFVGVVFLCQSGTSQSYPLFGLVLSFLSGLSYAIFIVIINRSRTVMALPASELTFYSLATGAVGFFIYCLATRIMEIPDVSTWGNFVGLAIFPTLISTAALAVATRWIGATKASVLGVFEPVTAIAIGVLVLGDPMNVYIVIGLILTMAAIVFMTLSERGADVGKDKKHA